MKGRAACTGDREGPLMRQGVQKNGRWQWMALLGASSHQQAYMQHVSTVITLHR